MDYKFKVWEYISEMSADTSSLSRLRAPTLAETFKKQMIGGL